MFTNSYIADFLIGYTLLTAAMYALSLVVPKAAFAARVLASYMSLAVVALYGVFASLFLTLMGYQGVSQWAVGRAFKFLMRHTTGVEFEIEDPKGVLGATRPAVFIGNHQTELDVLMLGSMFPKYCSVTAKSSLRKVPILGWFMSLSGSIFIDRKNSKDARDAMRGAANEIRAKRQSVYMFPEGTRSYAKDPVLLPFKKGAFHLAVEAEVPIVPVVVANYSHVLYVKGMDFKSGRIPIKGAYLTVSRYLPSRRSGPLPCCPPPPSINSSSLDADETLSPTLVLDPIPTKGLTSADVEELTRITREKMLKELVILSEKAQGRPMAMPAELDAPSKARTTGIEATAGPL